MIRLKKSKIKNISTVNKNKLIILHLWIIYNKIINSQLPFWTLYHYTLVFIYIPYISESLSIQQRPLNLILPVQYNWVVGGREKEFLLNFPTFYNRLIHTTVSHLLFFAVVSCSNKWLNNSRTNLENIDFLACMSVWLKTKFCFPLILI